MTDLILEGKGLRTDSSALRSGESPANDIAEPRHVESGAYSDGMDCKLLTWAASQSGLSMQQYAVLVAIARRAVGGKATLSKAELATQFGVSERQIGTILGQLEERMAGAFERTQTGASGRGRASNTYTLAGSRLPASGVKNETCRKSSSGSQLPPSGLAGSPVPEADFPQVVENPPLKYIYNTPLEVYPETPVLASTPAMVVVAASSDRPPPPVWQRLADDVKHSFLDPNKSIGLVTSGAAVASWLAAGADYDLDVLPTVRAVMGRKRSPVHSWAYFTDAIRTAVAQRLAAEQPLIFAPESAHVESGSVSTNDLRRGKLSPASAVLLRQMSGR